MLEVGTRALSPIAVEFAGDVGAACDVEVADAAAAGAVDVPPALIRATGAFAASLVLAGVGLDFGADEEATSPVLDFRAEVFDFADADLRPSALELRAVSAEARSSEAFRIQPSRVTFAHPVGALPPDNETVVPASSDATLRAVLAPRVRTTADRVPTRGEALPRCADRRDRSM
jgi:hypothetical protein